MRGTIIPLPQYAFMAWCLAKAQGSGGGSSNYNTFLKWKASQGHIY
jgi:hypothetical protein